MDVRVFRPRQDGESENPRAIRSTGAIWTSTRHFFGDFLCASKESYPPQAEALHFEPWAHRWDPHRREEDVLNQATCERRARLRCTSSNEIAAGVMPGIRCA